MKQVTGQNIPYQYIAMDTIAQAILGGDRGQYNKNFAFSLTPPPYRVPSTVGFAGFRGQFLPIIES